HRKRKKNFVKVVAFGIAKLTSPDGVSTGRTQAGMVMGTPAYMSPEQRGGKTPLSDGRSDVYSLGVMMFQLATGKLPFPGSSFGEVLIGHIQVPPPRPRDLNRSVPETYEAVILKALEKHQDQRYQTMAEMHEAILGVMQQLGISNELPTSDKTEEMPAIDFGGTPSNPALRTPSQPGRTTPLPASAPGRSQGGSKDRISRSGRRSSNPRGREPQMAGVAVGDRPRTKARLILGIAAALVLLLAGGAYFYVEADRTPLPPPRIVEPQSVFVVIVYNP